MIWVVAVAVLGAERVVDFEVAALASMPERFTACVGLHPARPLEVDLCTGLDRGVIAMTGHVFARKVWDRKLAGRELQIGFGGGVGPRVSSYCPVGACALQAGAEALLSLEGVWWVSHALGLTLQLDGGLAVLWGEVARNLVELSFRFPARLLLGVAL